MTQPENALVAAAQPAAKEAETTAADLYASAIDVEVSSPTTRESAVLVGIAIKRRREQLEETRKAITGPLDEAKKRIMELFAPALSRITEGETYVRKAISDYDEVVKRQLEQEAAAAAAAARMAQEAALARAAELEAEGREDEAEEVRYQAEAMPLQQETVRVAGGTTRWKAEVTDKRAFIKAVAAGKIPLEFVDVNMPKLNGIARSLQTSMAASYPGARAVAERSTTLR